MPRARAIQLLAQNDVKGPVALIGIRGYYLDSMGAKGKNDLGIYDDAMFLVTPEAYVSFNANTDPSRLKSGVASLLPGVHPYRRGKHGLSKGAGYDALRPATPGELLPVKRHGETKVPSARPGQAINIHRGSRRSTSSEGCQTIHPDQWQAFITLVYDQMKRAGAERIPYLLLEEETLRKL